MEGLEIESPSEGTLVPFRNWRGMSHNWTTVLIKKANVGHLWRPNSTKLKDVILVMLSPNTIFNVFYYVITFSSLYPDTKSCMSRISEVIFGAEWTYFLHTENNEQIHAEGQHRQFSWRSLSAFSAKTKCHKQKEDRITVILRWSWGNFPFPGATLPCDIISIQIDHISVFPHPSSSEKITDWFICCFFFPFSKLSTHLIILVSSRYTSLIFYADVALRWGGDVWLLLLCHI